MVQKTNNVHKPTYEETQNDVNWGPRCCMCATRVGEDDIMDHLMDSHVMYEYLDLARDVMEVNWKTEKTESYKT